MQILYFVYFLYLACELNEPARAFNEPSRAELAFWLVSITSRVELARYLNEPEPAEQSQLVIQPYPQYTQT